MKLLDTCFLIDLQREFHRGKKRLVVAYIAVIKPNPYIG